MLRIENLTKRYGGLVAVDDLSLEIKEGEIFGFVGPNGAGKTTTIKMICALLSPTKGKVYIDGVDVHSDVRAARSKIGYMPDFFGVYDNLKVSEYMEFYADVSKVDKNKRQEIIDDLLILVDLVEKKNTYVDSLSRGMKQRLCLARALVHDPKILILDEPASGMDPRARVQMKEILKELKSMGKTIIISSHILPELAEICTTIGIINKGKIIHKGTVEEINAQVHGANPIQIKYLESDVNLPLLIKEEPNVSLVYESEGMIEIKLNGKEEEAADFLKYLVDKGCKISSFSRVGNSLEDIFMAVTGGDDNE